jgi:hypothetical protein
MQRRVPWRVPEGHQAQFVGQRRRQQKPVGFVRTISVPGSQRRRAAGWLKMMENTTAKAADHNGALAIYDFGWLWNELGIDELRR